MTCPGRSYDDDAGKQERAPCNGTNDARRCHGAREREDERSKAPPSHARQMPREPQHSLGVLTIIVKQGQIMQRKEPAKDEPLSEVGMCAPDESQNRGSR